MWQKLGDLIYRLLLWSGVSFLIHFLAAYVEHQDAVVFSEALKTPPNARYGEILIGFALLMFVIAMMMFDAHRAVKRVGLLSMLARFLSHWLSRIASDLVLSAYGMASFILGWYLYELAYNIDADLRPTFARSILLGMDLPMFAVLLWALGILSLFVRYAPRTSWLLGWYDVRAWLRIVVYVLCLGALYSVFRNPEHLLNAM
ncbi:MAG: hypothetical protein OEW08_06495 [Gammaproteobacteria bacterium]|nr:hypothetical protein [Gammaproteobacteria bacterium]